MWTAASRYRPRMTRPTGCPRPRTVYGQSPGPSYRPWAEHEHERVP